MENLANVFHTLHTILITICRPHDFHAQLSALCISKRATNSLFGYARRLLSKLLVVRLAHGTKLRER